ncbi:MAG: hypothetical protein GY874_08855 [Desulfobacteraceae bacterium]|nr:hypothetical protein [Desulfobacteraceae bacterium]
MSQRNYTVSGLIATLAGTAFFIAAAFEWHHIFREPQPSAQQVLTEQIKARKHLKQIYKAQKHYILKDYDQDGKKEYARFLVHLWQSVTPRGEAFRCELIPKRLGFAMGPSRAVDGYYFLDVHEPNHSKQKGTVADQPIDYTKQWAIAGIPSRMDKTNTLFFIANQSGNIYAKNFSSIPANYPHDPLSDGWVKISDPQSLKPKR